MHKSHLFTALAAAGVIAAAHAATASDANEAAIAHVTTYVESLSQQVAAIAARESFTAYVESLSQKLALAPPATVSATASPLLAAQ
jgi:hypothetical protein